MYVLMIVMTLASGQQSVTTQEFLSEQSCKAVAEQLKQAEQMDRIRAGAADQEPPYSYSLQCVPK
jgi:hypothetical protein